MKTRLSTLLASRSFTFSVSWSAPTAYDCNEQRIFLVGVRHRRRAVNLRHVNTHALLQHRRDHHEDDKQHQHHVHHGSDVDVGVDLLAFFPFYQCHCVQPPALAEPASPGDANLQLPAYLATLQEIVDQLA